MRSSLAIFGGTFDPIHTAHLTVAKEAVVQYGLSSVLFVVAANPPHKVGATHASYEDRFRMVELACQRPRSSPPPEWRRTTRSATPFRPFSG